VQRETETESKKTNRIVCYVALVKPEAAVINLSYERRGKRRTKETLRGSRFSRGRNIQREKTDLGRGRLGGGKEGR